MKPIYEPKGKAKEYGDLASSSEYAVYMHEFPNGKRYIGISKDVKRRFRNGRGYEKQRVMHSAILKYGWENIKTTILYEHMTQEEAKQKEIDLIAFYKLTDREFGYNQTLGGEGGNGRIETEENKRKTGERMSKLHKGVPLSEEHKRKLSDAQKGKPKNYSDSGRRRIIESNRTRGYSNQTREKISQNTRTAMREKNMREYLSRKWEEDKEGRKAKLRIAMYDRYGVIPKSHDLRNDVVALGLDPNDYEELFKDSLRKEMER